MDPEKKLSQEVEEYAALAKENKNIDVTALMINALQTQNKNLVSSKWKKWAYLTSISAPPFGFLFALKFYLSDEDDAAHVANVCVILTVIAVAIFLLFGKLLLSGSGTSLKQIEQIKPSDAIQLYQ